MKRSNSFLDVVEIWMILVRFFQQIFEQKFVFK